MSTDQWQHLSLVFDGTNFRVYKNGVLSDTFSDPVAAARRRPAWASSTSATASARPSSSTTSPATAATTAKRSSGPDLTALNNGYGRRRSWLAAHQLHNHAVNTIDQWAHRTRRLPGLPGLQLGQRSPNTPNGCDDPPGGEDQALYFDEAPTSKIEETIAYDHALGSVYQYLWLPNRYNVDLNYSVYSTGAEGRLDESTCSTSR